MVGFLLGRSNCLNTGKHSVAGIYLKNGAYEFALLRTCKVFEFAFLIILFLDDCDFLDYDCGLLF